MTSSAKSSRSSPPPSPATKPSSFSPVEMLTPSEIESLRRDKIESGAFYEKAFAHLPKIAPKTQVPTKA